MIYPQSLQKNDTIGVTATSGGLEEERDLHKLENAVNNIKELGFHVIETPNVRKCDKLVSSSAKERAKEFMDLWQNDAVKEIILARGGEFLMEMLPYLDDKILSENAPKWVQGFSDSSILLYYLTTCFEISTIHAENFSAYGMRKLHSSLLTSLAFVQNPTEELVQESFELYEINRIRREEGMELEPFNLTEKVIYRSLDGSSQVSFEGILLGGCMDALKVLLGTPFDKTVEFCRKHPEGIVWYLENCEMSVTELYRALWQMKTAGWFDTAKGIIIGRTMAKDSLGEFTYEDALRQAFGDLKAPVIYEADFGHVSPQWTMVNGSYAKFTYEEGKGCLITQLK